MDNPIITNIISTMTDLTLNDNQKDNQMDTTFINDMDSLSLRENKTNETNETYQAYEPYKPYQAFEPYYDYDRTEFKGEMDTTEPTNNTDNTDAIDLYDNSPYKCFGIPNIYCKVYFDDEDFIFNRYSLSNDIKNKIKINNSIDEYVNNYCIGNGIVLDYDTYSTNPYIYYGKILYIYKYIENYYKDLKHLQPIERIKYLPEHLLHWVDNIVYILKEVINEITLQSETFTSISNMYFKELTYGLNIIICELRLMLNYYKNYNLCQLEEQHIKSFFKIVNNMCVCMIFMWLNKID